MVYINPFTFNEDGIVCVNLTDGDQRIPHDWINVFKEYVTSLGFDFSRDSAVKNYLIVDIDAHIFYTSEFINHVSYHDVSFDLMKRTCFDEGYYFTFIELSDNIDENKQYLSDLTKNYGTKVQYNHSQKHMMYSNYNNMLNSIEPVEFDDRFVLTLKEFSSWLAEDSFEVDFFRHEALHTSSVILEMIDNHLADHHYYHQTINPKYNALVDKAIDALYAVYSSIDEENETFKRMRSIL